MSERNWLDILARVVVISVVPLMACLGYYAMAGGGHVVDGVSRLAGVALGLVSLLGVVGSLRAPEPRGKSVTFWCVFLLLALLLIATSFLF